MKERKIKFIVYGARWFDKINGNTYHSVTVIRCRDSKAIAVPWQYGYDNCYQQTALKAMLDNGWLPKKYNEKNVYLYDRENNYPIIYNVTDGLKRDMVANGIL